MIDQFVDLPKQIMILYPLFEKVGDYYYFKNREIWGGDVIFRIIYSNSKRMLEVKSSDFSHNDIYTLYATLDVDSLKPNGFLVVKDKKMLSDKAICDLYDCNIVVSRPVTSYQVDKYPMKEIYRRYTIQNIIDNEQS